MPDVLVRNVSADDLDRLRDAAAEQGVSLQSYLRNAVSAQAAYLRRQAALAEVSERLNGDAVPAGEREAVLDAIDVAHNERADRLSDRPAT